MGFACSGVPTFQEISQEETRYSRVHPGFQITHRRAFITAPWTKSTLSLNLIVVTGFSEMLMNKCAVFKASSFVAFFHHLPLRIHDVSGGAISAAFRFPGIILMKRCRREGALHR